MGKCQHGKLNKNLLKTNDLNKVFINQKDKNIKEQQEKVDKLNKINKELIELNEKLIKNNDKGIIDLICQKEKNINILKSVIPFDVKEGEKLMCVII